MAALAEYDAQIADVVQHIEQLRAEMRELFKKRDTLKAERKRVFQSGLSKDHVVKRCVAAFEQRCGGATYKEIGANMGVSTSRAREVSNKGRLMVKHPSRKALRADFENRFGPMCLA